jgi:glycerophosphoryl diester phosphodiesterase
MPPEVDAHRGECGIAGLSANERYRRAIELGVDWVEIDVRRTSDLVDVNYHDDLTPTHRAVSSMTWAELSAELGSQAQTVDEVLDIIVGKVGLHVDVKEHGYEQETVAKLLARIGEGRIVFTGEDDSVRVIKETFPQVLAGLTLGWDSQGATPWLTLKVRLSELFPHRRVVACHADFIAAHQRLARANVLRYCARRGMPAWVWTVDEPVEIARFMSDQRVTVLITNHPDVALGG